jgi:hypothetical protein
LQQRTKEHLATSLGFLVTPLVPASAVAIADDMGRGTLGTIAVLTAIYYPITIVFSFWLAIPAYLLLKKFSLVRWWSATSIGMLAGAVFALTFYSSRLWTLPLFGGVGALSGLTFWVIWRMGHSLQCNRTKPSLRS